jgi:AraC-like DNA-binding protein
VLLYCASVGVDPRRIMQAAGVEFPLDEEFDGLLAYDQVVALWTHAYLLTGDLNLALHVAEWAPTGPRSVLYYLCLNAPTVGAAVERLALHRGSLDDTTTLSISEHPLGVCVTHEKAGGRVAARQELEYFFGMIYCAVRSATCVVFSPLRVEFAVEGPENLREHERLFGCPVLFNQEQSRLWFRSCDWRLPNRSGDDALLRILELHATRMADELPGLSSVRAAVKASVSAALQAGAPSLEQVAKQLRLSARTLQRRLAAEGATFAEVVDSTREAIAHKLLRQRELSLAEIAHLVGFSEQSAFTRAFKKWTGTTPAQFRRATWQSQSTT